MHTQQVLFTVSSIKTYIIDDFGQEHPNGMGITFQNAVWQALRLGGKFYVDVRKKNNPYREPARGANIWGYYFDQEPPTGPTEEAPVEDPLDVPLSGHRAWDIAHQRAIQSFAARHFRLRPEIQAEVDSFKRQFFKGRVLAVHTRGTDKRSEYRAVAIGETLEQIAAEKERLRCETIFLMTDCVDYHEAIVGRFGAQSLTIPRSHLSLHHNPPRGPYLSGLWCIMDGWLAASANAFLYSPSNTASIPLILGQHEEILRLRSGCVIEPFCSRVDRALGLL